MPLTLRADPVGPGQVRLGEAQHEVVGQDRVGRVRLAVGVGASHEVCLSSLRSLPPARPGAVCTSATARVWW